MDKLVDLLYEIGILKRVKRSGWWIAGVKDPETVAEHSFRATIIGYMLAMLEGIDSNKVVKMCLLHDIEESRLTDINKITSEYIDKKQMKQEAIYDQVSGLPSPIKEEFLNLVEEFTEQKTSEAQLARDADLLECAIQAKEYIESGHESARDWIVNIRGLLKNEVSKNMLKTIEETSSQQWWQGLKKL